MSITSNECVVTFFADAHARTRREETLPLDALAARIYNAHAAKKAALPLLKLARFGDSRSDKKALRRNANVLAISGIEADYDGEKVPFDAAVKCLHDAGLCSIAYTTPTYTAARPKWRVLCLFSQELPPDQRDRMMARLAGLFAGIDVEFAGESWTLSQSYYYGSVNNNPAHQVQHIDGTPIDLRDDLDAAAVGKPERQQRNGAATRAVTATRPEDITDKRIRGLVDSLLSKLRNAKDREKHYTLLRIATTLGGYLHLTGWTEAQAVEQLIGALPDSVEDWEAAEQTALDGLQKGTKTPLALEDRPRKARANGSEPPSGWEAAHPPAETADARSRRCAAPAAPEDWPEPVDCFHAPDTDPVDITEADAPPALWPFVKDTAERMGVTRATVALSCLVTCSAVISDLWRLQPKRRDYTWTENARLWGAIVGPPSIKKSPVLVACTRPVDLLESEARKQWQEEKQRHDEQLAAWQNARKAAKALGDDFTDPKPQPPRRPRWLVESTTVEALQEVLRDDEGARFTAPAAKVLVRQDELAEFIANLDRYSGGRSGGDRGAYLRLYNGGPFSVDRIGRGAFAASNWSGCLLGGVQPEPIQRIATHAVDDGLLQRFIYDVPPPSTAGTDRAPDHEAITRYRQLIQALAAMQPPAAPQGTHQAPVVLHADAHPHRESIDTLARDMAAMPDASSRLRATFGKWPGLFGRLCLTFHLIEVANARAQGSLGAPVDVVPPEIAERIARYMRRVLLPHLLAADAVMFNTVQTGHARWIAGHILAHQLDRIAVRDVNRAYWALRAPETRDELQSVMTALVNVGWLDPEPSRNPLNPVSAWRVNPHVHKLFADRAKQESQERRVRAAETIKRRQGAAAA